MFRFSPLRVGSAEMSHVGRAPPQAPGRDSLAMAHVGFATILSAIMPSACLSREGAAAALRSWQAQDPLKGNILSCME